MMIIIRLDMLIMMTAGDAQDASSGLSIVVISVSFYVCAVHSKCGVRHRW